MKLRAILMAGVMTAGRFGPRIRGFGRRQQRSSDAALVDVGRRSRRAQRHQAGSRQAGLPWKDVPVAGGGGGAAMTTLESDGRGGQSADRLQMLGYYAMDYAEAGEARRHHPSGDEGRLGQSHSDRAAEIHHR